MARKKTEPLLLREVRLERFKAAFMPDPIPLTPFTVVIGRNGSGKSTFLEALQWVDRTLREDARRACERYQGIHDIINVRSQTKRRFFGLEMTWEEQEESANTLRYHLEVDEGRDASPLIHREKLTAHAQGRRTPLIDTTKEGDAELLRPGERVLLPKDKLRKGVFDDPDRLVLGRLGRTSEAGGLAELGRLKDFWDRAVFLRLSPSSLAGGSLARRASFEPLLDEEGHMLPALLSELSAARLKRVVADVNEVLHDIKGLRVTKPRRSREERVHFSLLEEMPYVGRKGRGTFEIPAWMLSEGTRRITALFALLNHDPPPSLLCVEEIENGLDPWTTLNVLRKLRSAALNGIQVLVTTHSPWLLDHVQMSDVLLVKREVGETRYYRASDTEEFKTFSADIPPGARYVNLEQSP
jgi:predicted ATPase